jgi:DNA topoisomerase-1
MIDAQMKKTRITANITKDTIPDFTVTGSRIITPGWLAADPAARKDDVEVPLVASGEKLDLIDFHSEEKETTPPPRYSEAGLVKELEKRGIGRPSTYASIIRTIQTRGYVEKEGRSLKPTDTGEVVSDFLSEHFGTYISDTFTAEMEDELDDIARGERDYTATLAEFYKPFHKDVLKKAKLDKATDLGDADAKMRCPKCKGPMIIKLGKNGKFLSCKKFPECDGARTLEGKEMAGPKETGERCPQCDDGKLVEREGKFGKFISCSNYPKCKFIKEDPAEAAKKKTGVQCPECGKGEMIERNGRFGIFYSCSTYPKCKNAIKSKPTGRFCTYKRDERNGEKCGALMMEGTKTIPERCSDKTCPNHRPDKLRKK